MRVAAEAVPAFRDQVEQLARDPANRKAKLHQLLNAIAAKGGDIRVFYTTGHWLDVDSLEDLVAAGEFA